MRKENKDKIKLVKEKIQMDKQTFREEGRKEEARERRRERQREGERKEAEQLFLYTLDGRS